jgi:hypothetical protein
MDTFVDPVVFEFKENVPTAIFPDPELGVEELPVKAPYPIAVLVATGVDDEIYDNA